MKRKIILWAGIALLVVMAGVAVWNVWFSATRIAFVNYQVITLGQIAKSNDNSRISLSALDAEELDLSRQVRYGADQRHGPAHHG